MLCAWMLAEKQRTCRAYTVGCGCRLTKDKDGQPRGHASASQLGKPIPGVDEGSSERDICYDLLSGRHMLPWMLQLVYSAEEGWEHSR